MKAWNTPDPSALRGAQSAASKFNFERRLDPPQSICSLVDRFVTEAHESSFGMRIARKALLNISGFKVSAATVCRDSSTEGPSGRQIEGSCS